MTCGFWMASFHERQRELCLLSSFISDQEKWLDSVLNELKWSKGSLQDGHELVKCPYNEHHYVPSKSLDSHKNKCFYASKGVDLDESDPLTIDKDTLYQIGSAPTIEIDSSIERAVLECAKDPDLYKERDPGPGKTQESSESVEDSVRSGLVVSSLQPQQVISYVKSWRKVPLDWTAVLSSSINVVQLKGWLFHNLPRDHAHSSSVGGEIIAVDTIISCLMQPGGSTITPNKTIENLRPLLRTNAGPFVLSLWKHLHISQTQSQHGILDSAVEDIAPMPLSQLLTLQRGAAEMEKEEPPLVYHKIKELSQDKTASASSDALPLPMDAVFFAHTPTERRVMYDYVVEASQMERPKKKKTIDPDLYRDDEAALKAKLKALAQQEQSGAGEESKSFQEILRERKEKRDYKRRRQKYRAKNVHITRRKTSEIFRDIINNRMGEIMGTLGPQNTTNAMEATGVQTVREVDEPHNHSARDSEHQEHTGRAEQRERGGRKRHLSRSRSRSRERHHSHKKYKKHRSHKHSSSREHKRDRSRAD